jgi:hypothetical protein
LTRQRLPPVTHTDALFADQSHSILDNLVELLESGANIGPMAKMLGQVAYCLYRRANRMAASGAQSRRSWPAVIRQELPLCGHSSSSGGCPCQVGTAIRVDLHQ